MWWNADSNDLSICALSPHKFFSAFKGSVKESAAMTKINAVVEIYEGGKGWNIENVNKRFGLKKLENKSE